MAATHDIRMARKGKRTRNIVSKVGTVQQHVINALPDQRWITIQCTDTSMRMYKHSKGVQIPATATSTERARIKALDTRLQLQHDTLAFRLRLRGTPMFPIPQPVVDLAARQRTVTHPAPGGTSDDDAMALQCTLSPMPLFLEGDDATRYHAGDKVMERAQQRLAGACIQIIGPVHNVDSKQDNAARTTVQFGVVTTVVPQEDMHPGD